MSSSQREDVFTIQFGSLKPVVVPVVAQRLIVETSLASNDEKDGQLSLDESQGSQNRLRHHHSVVERDKARKRILDMQGARRGRRQNKRQEI